MNNPQQHERIRDLYRIHRGNIHKVARDMGLKPHEVTRAIVPQPILLRDPADDQPKPGRDERGFYALGRPELRPFILSFRHASGSWPEEDRRKLVSARQKYDAGTHIMTQGRDGCWIIQYLWQRHKPVAPTNWFYGAFQ